jgi:hypothetical protein
MTPVSDSWFMFCPCYCMIGCRQCPGLASLGSARSSGVAPQKDAHKPSADFSALQILFEVQASWGVCSELLWYILINVKSVSSVYD